VGYYAYIRALLIEHKLDFSNDWQAANQSFAMARVRPDGKIDPAQYTATGHLDNHWAVGPSILWAPFLVPVHLTLTVLHRFGVNVRPDGFSRPYIVTMGIATALYGFLGLWFSFRLASVYTEKRWALLATLGLWFASSLPVYMYFNPSWSHAHSVFIVAAFLWFWHKTRQHRALWQWVILGLISGLMLDIYYVNIAILVIPLLESLESYYRELRLPERDWHSVGRIFIANVAYCLATMIAFLPTLVSRQIIYGYPLELGYGNSTVWHWNSPRLLSILFSSDHGLLSWTPIVIPAVLGLFLFFKYDSRFSRYLIAACVGFYYIIAIDPCWDGISSFGNRKFISLTPLFVIGLAVFLSELAVFLRQQRQTVVVARSMVGLLVIWNLAFVFQWGTHMIPARGPISWKQMVRNQFVVVPQRVAADVRTYVANRQVLMQQIEQEDIGQLKTQEGAAEEGR